MDVDEEDIEVINSNVFMRKRYWTVLLYALRL